MICVDSLTVGCSVSQRYHRDLFFFCLQPHLHSGLLICLAFSLPANYWTSDLFHLPLLHCKIYFHCTVPCLETFYSTYMKVKCTMYMGGRKNDILCKAGIWRFGKKFDICKADRPVTQENMIWSAKIQKGGWISYDICSASVITNHTNAEMSIHRNEVGHLIWRLTLFLHILNRYNPH